MNHPGITTLSRYLREIPLEPRRKWKHFHRYFHRVEGRILDIGSSHGNFAQHRPQKVVGIDFDRAALRLAHRRGLPGVCGDLDGGLPFRSHTFAAINCDSVVEHVAAPRHLLEELHRVLAPGGFVVLVTPDLKRVKLNFWRDYTHRTPFLRESLRQLLLDTGFRDLQLGRHAFHYLKFLEGRNPAGWHPTSARRRLLGAAEDLIAAVHSTNLLAVGHKPAGPTHAPDP